MGINSEIGELDSTNTREVVESIKRQGNEHFVAKRYAEAVKCYGRAIDITSSNHVLFGNRSAAYRGLGDWELAASDARRSVALEPGYTKGFYRLAQALIQLGDSGKAATAIEDGLRVDPENIELAALKRRIARSRLRGQQNCAVSTAKAAARSATAASAAGIPNNAAGRLDLSRAGLYDDKDAPEEGSQTSEVLLLKRLYSCLRESVASSGGGHSLGRGCVRHELDGVFSRLIEPEQFRRIALPRLSEQERRSAPSSLQELVRTPVYASALEEALPRVVSSAASVLQAVKRRGREKGEIMDAATEEALKPQVLQEAFAREVISVITGVQAKARAQAVADKGRLASPTREEASWDQLHDATVAGLSSRGKSFSVQDSFFGEEWVSPLLEDSLRFKAAGKLYPLGLEREHGEMAWVEPEQLKFDYPALHELIVNLHALAFELNLKNPGLGLSRPCQGSTMLLKLTEGSRVPARLDSIAGGVQTGYRISAVYFVGRCTGAADGNTGVGNEESITGMASGDSSRLGGQLKLQNMETAASLAEVAINNGSGSGSGSSGSSGGSPVPPTPLGGEKDADVKDATCDSSNFDGEGAALPGVEGETFAARQGAAGVSVVLEPTPDRLVLFRSDRVSTETLKVLGHGQEQYAVLFWMHGTKQEAGGAVHGDNGSPPCSEGSEPSA